MGSKMSRLAQKREELLKEEKKALKKIDIQSDAAKSSLKSKTAIIAMVGAGLLVGYGIYKLATIENKSDEPKKKKNRKWNTLVNTVVEELTKGVVPMFMSWLQSQKSSFNDTQSTSRK